MQRTTAIVALALIGVSACQDGSNITASAERPAVVTAPLADAQANNAASTSSVRWNRIAIALFRARGGGASRTDTYLALAQYRAVLAADAARHGGERPSLAGAAAGASVVVLKQFYPLDAAALEATIAAQSEENALGEEHNKDFADGEAIGRTVGAQVLALAATDNYGATSPGNPPVGPGYWVSSGAPTVRGGFGARPFFLQSGSEIRLGPPPAFGSPAYLAALAEVRAYAQTRTPEQVAIVTKWVPFSGVLWNGIASDLIDQYHRSELEAARIFAYGNTAAWDAIVACFDTKFTYWLIRPTQADPTITLATALPNHPSYPSAHACETGAWQVVLSNAFPAERDMIDATAQEATLSRVLGGLHYRFDGEGGLSLGRTAAALALTRRGLE